MNIKLNVSLAAGRLFGQASFQARLLAAMFCLGMYSLLAQLLMLRELLVVFFGNELTIGAIFGSWLIGVSVGSLAIYRALKRLPVSALKHLVAILLCVLAFLLPAQVLIIRELRAVLHVPFGEYVPFGAMLVSTGVIFLPTCLVIGVIFPSACQLVGEREDHPVSRVYALDALGSMIGGILFTFLFSRVLTHFSTVALAGACVLIGAALVENRTKLRCCIFLFALCFAVAGFCPKCLDGIELASIKARWRAFGYMPAQGRPSQARLLTSVDSQYQNLALIETEGQKTLYGNGQVMFVFPDPIAGEHKIHFIMAQNPGAESVLFIGGNPVTDIPELLKYPLERLAYVELDKDIRRILDTEAGLEYREAVQYPRFREYPLDGPRFVKSCRETFDVIIVQAPSPTTVALNRFFTLEFYQDIKRILAPHGFLYTSIESSVHLQDETARLSASVYRSLRSVFNRVLVTAGTHNQFFAGMAESPITFDRETLLRRSADARLNNRYFRPEYFLSADEISPDKTAFVEKRLRMMRVPANTALKPVSTFYYLALWSRFSGSRLQPFLNSLRQVRFSRMRGMILSTGALFLLIGGLLKAWKKKISIPVMPGIFRVWSRSMVGIAIATTGCCEMALEIILIFVFQSLFGYVYVAIGLIIAMFMLGLVLGSVSAVPMMKAPRIWLCMIGLECVIMCVALVIPFLMTRFSSSSMLPVPGVIIEALIYALVILVGFAGGAQFPLGNRIIRKSGELTGSTAALTNAADLFGGALGGFAVGVFLLPLFGIGASCMMLAILKSASILCLLSARWVTYSVKGENTISSKAASSE